MAQIFKRNTEKKGLVVVWKIEESADELLQYLKLRRQDLERVKSFKLEARKQEFLAARCLIKQVLGAEPEIDYLDSGKPILKNSPYKISISHTKGYVVVAFSENNLTGVDIEHPSDRVARVSKRFVSSQEERFIPDNKKVEYYTIMWCLKESMYKMYDRQNSIFNINFICHPFKLQREGKISATFDFEERRTMDFEYLTTEDFYLVYHC
ncbi:4'-phosphopantetheinyl transferase family protein [Saccharicrinis fermentans]|uniref:Holo-(Acyl carrier protein) synthase 2 n=1 Tax=Saccharicrinis fermentans DSM 9555 = JCM 21142 TaxID=869213 RepID=W7YJK4_9BACT|nr:4'-phosphopantetheinyl transferase family protein [Saccharicrinis fermentans]GAF04706.1 holo-(acyl carrier protein) synthase 2 [Saccharicrinis fermentans DSM 9555 = JCM 21142]